MGSVSVEHSFMTYDDDKSESMHFFRLVASKAIGAISATQLEVSEYVSVATLLWRMGNTLDGPHCT